MDFVRGDFLEQHIVQLGASHQNAVISHANIKSSERQTYMSTSFADSNSCPAKNGEQQARKVLTYMSEETALLLPMSFNLSVKNLTDCDFFENDKSSSIIPSCSKAGRMFGDYLQHKKTISIRYKKACWRSIVFVPCQLNWRQRLPSTWWHLVFMEEMRSLRLDSIPPEAKFPRSRYITLIFVWSSYYQGVWPRHYVQRSHTGCLLPQEEYRGIVHQDHRRQSEHVEACWSPAGVVRYPWNRTKEWTVSRCR